MSSTTSSLRYLILQNIDLCSLSATHAYYLETLVRSVREIKDDVLVCGSTDTWQKYIEAYQEDQVLYVGVPSSGVLSRYLYRVNLVPLLVTIRENKELYQRLFGVVGDVVYRRIVGTLMTVLPKDLWHKRRLVALLVGLTIASLIVPTLRLSNLTTYLDKSIKYTDIEVNVMQRYLDGNSIPMFWLQYIKEVVLENRLSLASLSYVFKKSRVHDLTLLIDSLYNRSLECRKPFAYHLFLDLIFGLLRLPYSVKIWRDIVEVFESIVERGVTVE